MAAIQAVPVSVFTDIGKWIIEKVAGGIGTIGSFIQGILNGQTTEAGTPKGGTPVQTVTPNVNGDIAKGVMNTILEYWKRIAGDIQGIVPFLKVDPTTQGTALMDTLLKYWQSRSTTITAIKPALSVIIKSATGLIDSLLSYWQSRSKTISATVPKITVNNTGAFQIIDAVLKRWQSAARTISGIKPAITVNNSQAINAINNVIKAMNNVKNISRTITITTRYVTVGRPAAHNITGIKAHNIGGAGAGETMAAPLLGGGSTNTIVGGGQGDVNITIINRDEFGTDKVRRLKAKLGKDRYVFGSVGAGG